MSTSIQIHWFRQDLRIADNPALSAAAEAGTVLPIYILDDIHAGRDRMGAASRWWLHHSLHALNRSLNGNLLCLAGDPLEIIPRLAEKHGAERVLWNRCYEPWRTKRDSRLKEILKEQGFGVRSYNGALLWEPWDILKQDGTPYKVFTPYYKNGCLPGTPPRKPLACPARVNLKKSDDGAGTVDALGLLPNIRWDLKMEPSWEIGEHGAANTLRHFLDHGISDYKEGRDFPARKNVSRLSPYLHFGEISPNQIWHEATRTPVAIHTEAFLRELCWREFSNYLLYHFPQIPEENFNRKFDRFPWNPDTSLLVRWQQGTTGIPIVDAGMRELWETGSMHNRVRMIVASLLTKNMRLHWHHGRDWFNDCLVDADLANNCCSWQWVAGCGADAAPYFRIFNPVTQGQKFDPHGEYTRKYVPELARMPDKYLFNPWEAPKEILRGARITLGTTYPFPIVDLKDSRQRALDAYAKIKE
ncbi:MAG: deoxyribodipyrimidine photo-lyase [Pontiellaceae bacterium]|nr:deoxyribodipyrimidine photo-lyase [Pontiellaceae bacterium]MBN2785333.1 deoxyribodipyrimidine photo-lyase [Pontiellaceae bacterium]